MKFFDLDHVFFKPLWIRVLVSGTCLLWALVEFYSGSPFWGVLFAALGGYACWKFFLASLVRQSDKIQDDD